MLRYVLQGKKIRKKCILKVAFSLNNRKYNKKVTIQSTVQHRNIFGLMPIGSSNLVVIWALVQIYFSTVSCILTIY